MKKGIKYIITILFMFFTLLTRVGADWTGFNEGFTTSGVGGGKGEFYAQHVGLKVSIVKSQDKNNKFIPSYKFFNAGVDNELYYFNNTKPKFLQTDGGNWSQGCGDDCAYSAVLSGTSWYTVNFNSLLTNENIKILVDVITTKYQNITIDDNTYIVVEPMIKLGNSYGTAFELLASYANNTTMTCDGYSGFHICYGATFYGATWTSPVCQGCVYSTIHVTAKNPFITESDCDNDHSAFKDAYECKKYAIFDYWRGGSIGIYKASDLGFVPKEGKFKITKTKLNGVEITGKKATFNIYKGSSCKEYLKTVDVIGTQEITLSAGNYSLKETKAPDGYVLDDTCKSFTIEANKTKSISVANKTPCENDFGTNPLRQRRIELYKKYNYNQLLNFGETNASVACSNVTCTYTSSVGCLNASSGQNTTFGANNLSCYNETIEVNGKTGYCLTTFNLTNNLGKTNFSTFSGGMFINTSNPVATGTLKKVCYVYGDETGNYNEELNVKNYISNITFFNKELNSTSNLGSSSFKDGKYEFKSIIDYKLNPIYVKKGTGEKVDSKCPNCDFLGYGLISKLTDFGTYKVDFKISQGENSILKFDSIKEKDKCTYIAKRNIIEEDTTGSNSNKKQKLNLEFRIIDVNNPFPGKDGTGRYVGNNWCAIVLDGTLSNSTLLSMSQVISKGEYKKEFDINSDSKVDKEDQNILKWILQNNASNDSTHFNKNCSNDNWLIKYYMTAKSNTKNKSNAKYTIELDSSLIREIRNYNKSHSYEEYTLECENGENCKSSFLENLKNKNVLSITE